MARILVIEDDTETRVLLEQMLKSAGHEVVLAADGREGVKQHRTSSANRKHPFFRRQCVAPAEVAREPLLVFCRRDYPEYRDIITGGCANTGSGPESLVNTMAKKA
jgi:CheY-like chemotaxis protein